MQSPVAQTCALRRAWTLSSRHIAESLAQTIGSMEIDESIRKVRTAKTQAGEFQVERVEVAGSQFAEYPLKEALFAQMASIGRSQI